MTVLTWSYYSGYSSWTFFDNSTPNASAVRSHTPGAIRTQLTTSNAGASFAEGIHTSPDELNILVVNGDTVEADVSATSDLLSTRIIVKATYTDATTEQAVITNAIATTVTLTLTQNKTLDYVSVQDARSTSTPGAGTVNTRDIEEVRITTAGAISPTAGKLRSPATVIEDEGAGAAGGAGGGADNIAAISADGLYIYIASFNNLGFPTLIRIAATLAANGTVVFEPGAGGRIGVECEIFNADNVWVAGQFDGTNTVEQSEDDGATWTVKDDGTFGAIRTFRVGPDSDDRIILFDGDNGDLIQSVDGGATWTTTNAAVALLVNSIARFDMNPTEIVIGNQGGATDSIDYSPNVGANLEDYQTGVYPNANATKVIAN